jgi:hypothetical protein
MVGTTKHVMFKSMHQKQQAELLAHKLSKAVTVMLLPERNIWLCPPSIADLLG